MNERTCHYSYVRDYALITLEGDECTILQTAPNACSLYGVRVAVDDTELPVPVYVGIASRSSSLKGLASKRRPSTS